MATGVDVKVLNDYFDSLLRVARSTMQRSAESSVPLPDMEESFDSGRGMLKMKGVLRTSGGRLGDLRTLTRTGDVVLEKGPASGLSLSAEMGLQKAFLGVERYAVRLGRLPPLQGNLNLAVGRNSAFVKVILAPDNGVYKANLETAQIHYLDDFKVRITGLGPLNSLTGWAASKVVDSMKEEIKKRINEILETAIKDALVALDVNEIVKALVLSQVIPVADPLTVMGTLNTVREVCGFIFD